MINVEMMNGNANVCEVAPAIKGGISLTLSSCQIHHCQGWLPVSSISHQQHRGSSGVKEEPVTGKVKRKSVYVYVLMSACILLNTTSRISNGCLKRVLAIRTNWASDTSRADINSPCFPRLPLSPNVTCYFAWASCSLPLQTPSTQPKNNQRQRFCIRDSRAFTRVTVDSITLYVCWRVRTACLYICQAGHMCLSAHTCTSCPASTSSSDLPCHCLYVCLPARSTRVSRPGERCSAVRWCLPRRPCLFIYFFAQMQ